MAERVEIISITVPAGTLRATPQITDLDFRQGTVEQLEIRIPPGPAGLLGFRIEHSGQVIIPYELDEWLITDNEVIVWPLEKYPTGTLWRVHAFNEGVYEHTFQMRWLFGELVRRELATTQQIPITQTIASVGAQQEGVTF